MSDPKKRIGMPALGGQSKTLILSAPGKTGVLLEKVKRSYRETAMKFADAHAALDWCMEREVALLFLPSSHNQN